MQNPELLFSILGLVAFAMVAVLLIILWKKGLLTADALNALGDLVDGVILPEDGPIGTLAYYARLAVRAVEQLVKSGQLEKDDETRREKALELVEEYAAASGPALTDKEISTVRSLIEAEVYELRHTEAAMLAETIPMEGQIETVSPAAAAAAGTEEAAPAPAKKKASHGTKKPPDGQAAADAK